MKDKGEARIGVGGDDVTCDRTDALSPRVRMLVLVLWVTGSVAPLLQLRGHVKGSLVYCMAEYGIRPIVCMSVEGHVQAIHSMVTGPVYYTAVARSPKKNQGGSRRG